MIGQLLRMWRDELLRHNRELAEARCQLKYSSDSCAHGAWVSERCFSCEVGK